MNEEYHRGYVDALHHAVGVVLAFERISKMEAEQTVCKSIRDEIDAYLRELKAGANASDDTKRARLLAVAPELLGTLKHLLTAIEQGIEINPGLMLEYRFVVDRAEGK